MFVFKRLFSSQSVMALLFFMLGVLLYTSYSHAQQQDGVDEVASAEGTSENQPGETAPEEWEMDLSLPDAATSRPVNQGITSLPDPAQDRALQQLLSRLATDPNNAEILAQLNRLLAGVLSQARTLMDDGRLEEAEQMLAAILSIDPNLRGFQSAQRRLVLAREVEGLLVKGNAALGAQRVIEPENVNALYYFSQALRKDPNNSSVQSGLAQVQEVLVMRASESAQMLDFEMAGQWLQQASEAYGDQSLVDEASEQLGLFRDMHAEDLQGRVLAAIDAGNFNSAHSGINDITALGGQDERVNMLRERLGNARFYDGFQPGQIISDDFLQSGDKAPAIVVIPAGSFMMGSSDQSGSANNNEQPRHRVTIESGFGLGIREVTVEQFGLFIQRSGYLTAADRAGSSKIYDEAVGQIVERDGINWKNDYQGETASLEDPVIHVGFDDAQAYVQWLAAETGKHFRLPSEAEYEYVARAAGRGRSYWWGEGSPAKVVENLTGQRDESPSKRRWGTPFINYGDGYWGPAPTGSLEDSSLVHPMGVYDIAGNVSEWVEDCWHFNYYNAPADGSAWVDLGCKLRVVRGGYWASVPEQSRAAFRVAGEPGAPGPVAGIRVARDL